MTRIAEPAMVDHVVVNEVALSLFKGMGTDTIRMQKFFTVVDDKGTKRQVSFDQLEYLINLVDLDRQYLVRYSPTIFLIEHYAISDLKDLAAEGWVIPHYVIEVDSDKEIVQFSGDLVHSKTIEAHPDYEPGFIANTKSFEFTLERFGLIQQMGLSRVIAALHEKVSSVAGTFGVSYVLDWNMGELHLKTLDDLED